MIVVNQFASLIMVAMETGKRYFSDIIATAVKSKKYFIKNMNLIDKYLQWKKSVDWISTTQEKMLQPQKCIFSKKRTQKLKV